MTDFQVSYLQLCLLEYSLKFLKTLTTKGYFKVFNIAVYLPGASWDRLHKALVTLTGTLE